MSAPPPVSIDELLAQAGWVRRLALRLARDAQSADDLAQGALIAALESPPGGGRPLRPWLARVLTNLARKEQRGAARRKRREQEALSPDQDQPSADLLLEELEQQQRLAQQVARLRDPYRTVVLLHYYRGKSSGEIAAERGVAAATVRSQLARGLAQLRGQLAAEAGGDPERMRSALWLAAGLAAPVPIAGPAAASTLFATPSLFLMSSATKTLAVCAVFAAALTGVIGWRSMQGPSPLSPDPVEASQGLRPGTPASAAATGPKGAGEGAQDPGTRSSIATPEPAGGAEVATVIEEATKETTGFYGRAVDAAGRPIEGAAFASVDELGEPRGLGDSIPSDSTGRVHIELPRKAFFTYASRDVSNTYLALEAPGFATNFSVPAAAQGSDKDLGDIVLSPGATVVGTVVDGAGAPVADALVVAGVSGGGSEAHATVMGPEREGGRPSTHSDELGRFRLQGIPVGNTRVWANSPGMAWAASESLNLKARVVEAGITLVLDRLGAESMVQGVVENPQGAPVPGAKVVYRHPSQFDEVTIYCDELGAFAVAVPAGLTGRFRAYGPGEDFGPSAETLIAAGEVQARLALTERRVIQVLVLNKADGTPIERASVMTHPEHENTFFMDARRLRTGADGRVDALVPGEAFRLSVGGTGWKYQQLGVYEPASAPTEMTVELEAVPMIRGVVRAEGEPVAGAEIKVVRDCEARFRPLASGFPLRLFDGGHYGVKSDQEGGFAIPIGSSSEDPPVLLVSKDGYALAEVALGVVDESKGLDGVEVELSAGGSLEGSVTLGPGRNPASVVVGVSRGDGRPRFARLGADGRYRFDQLTPGPWRVEDRDIEPEGRIFSMAQGDEHPLRWDCEVHEGETTVHDLDLRWQDGLQVEGQLTWDGLGPKGWTASLEAPDHADRPWAPRLVNLDAEGRFALDARPGSAKLVLRSPEGADVRMVLERTITVGPEGRLHRFEFTAGAFQGQVDPAAKQLRLFHRIDGQTKLEVHFEADASGGFQVTKAPAGKASFQASEQISGGMAMFVGWTGLGMVDIAPGGTTEVDFSD